jgi:hypothetical protein
MCFQLISRFNRLREEGPVNDVTECPDLRQRKESARVMRSFVITGL